MAYRQDFLAGFGAVKLDVVIRIELDVGAGLKTMKNSANSRMIDNHSPF